MTKQKIMTINELKILLDRLKRGVPDDFQIWLSSDEEGNHILPVCKDTKLSLGIDRDNKRIIFFPSH